MRFMQVYTPDKAHEVGKISKQWSGFVREYFTSADNFGITFPMDLDVKMKANMIGALFLIVSYANAANTLSVFMFALSRSVGWLLPVLIVCSVLLWKP